MEGGVGVGVEASEAGEDEVEGGVSRYEVWTGY